MTEHKQTDEAALDMLLDEVEWLQEVIDGVDHNVSRAIQAHAEGISLRDDVIARIQQLYQTKHEFMFNLGRASVHIQQLEERIQRQRIQALEDRQQAETFALLENQLDWLELEEARPTVPSEDGAWQEPEPDER